MKILHICNGFSTSKLYHELFVRLAKNGVSQFVVAPTFAIPDYEIKDYRVEYFIRNSSIFSRLFYTKKLHDIIKFIELRDNTVDYSLIHAHTLFSDGIPAYWLSKKYNIPYIVAVRNSDINFFFKYFIHYRWLVNKLLKNASRIILLSPIYLSRLKASVSTSLFKEIERRIEIIPNGVNNFWLRNIHVMHRLNTPHHLVFCGRIDWNKNIGNIIKAVNTLNPCYEDYKISIIGRTMGQNDSCIRNVERLVRSSRVQVDILDRKTPNELMQFYRDCDLFVMPSKTETFGLVYAEALSQGLPIIYTRNEGFDGFFKNYAVGCAVDASNVRSIAEGISYCINHYTELISNISNIDFSIFNWDRIGQTYLDIYRRVYKMS